MLASDLLWDKLDLKGKINFEAEALLYKYDKNTPVIIWLFCPVTKKNSTRHQKQC